MKRIYLCLTIFLTVVYGMALSSEAANKPISKITEIDTSSNVKSTPSGLQI